jgi:hypothetical protein
MSKSLESSAWYPRLNAFLAAQPATLIAKTAITANNVLVALNL